jgi:murein DD-endopeptidase MepM/ murein hydrolase activator NlpD
LLDTAQQEEDSVETLLAEKQKQLATMQQQIDDTNAAITDKQTEIHDQEELIAEIEAIEQKRKEEEEKKRKEEEERQRQLQANNDNNSGNTSTIGSSGGTTTTYTTPSYSGGSFLWPVPGYTYITSDYGNRDDPFGVSSSSEYHKGIDIGAPTGTPIIAPADGVVAWSYHSNSAGNWVGIDHGDGLYTVFMHMSLSAVTEGQSVKAGDVIGYVGATGNVTGPHLHFAVRLNGSYVNPHNYLD